MQRTLRRSIVLVVLGMALMLSPSTANAHNCVFVDAMGVTNGDPMCPTEDQTTHFCTTEPVNTGTVTVCTVIVG